VEEFQEKPDELTALQYLESGDYYWNGGIFIFTAESYLGELKKFAPEVYRACVGSMNELDSDLDFLRVGAAEFAASPSISIDYAIMEHTDKAKVVPLDVGWNDIGSWSALWEISEKDDKGNSLHGDVLLCNTANSHIYSENKLVSAVGVEDLIIVATGDAVMVASKYQAQNVKQVVEQLKQQGRTQLIHHRKVYRPWGWYDLVDSGSRFHVKRIQVNPNSRLSVQMHMHRAEHWVIVKGVAEVLNGDRTLTLSENESTYIPIGVKHSLRNVSNTKPLEIIEVQSGSYLGEDDIVRFEDDYGRS